MKLEARRTRPTADRNLSPSFGRRGALLLASMLSGLIVTGAAHAQFTHTQFTHAQGSYNDLLRQEAAAKLAADKPKPVPLESDGLGGGGFFLQADEVIRRETAHQVEATGRVEARLQGPHPARRSRRIRHRLGRGGRHGSRPDHRR